MNQALQNISYKFEDGQTLLEFFCECEEIYKKEQKFTIILLNKQFDILEFCYEQNKNKKKYEIDQRYMEYFESNEAKNNRNLMHIMDFEETIERIEALRGFFINYEDDFALLREFILNYRNYNKEQFYLENPPELFDLDAEIKKLQKEQEKADKKDPDLYY